eukprot:scaffold52550_cov19-Tisochrysis_lutea.AAC.1
MQAVSEWPSGNYRQWASKCTSVCLLSIWDVAFDTAGSIYPFPSGPRMCDARSIGPAAAGVEDLPAALCAAYTEHQERWKQEAGRGALITLYLNGTMSVLSGMFFTAPPPSAAWTNSAGMWVHTSLTCSVWGDAVLCLSDCIADHKFS